MYIKWSLQDAFTVSLLMKKQSVDAEICSIYPVCMDCFWEKRYKTNKNKPTVRSFSRKWNPAACHQQWSFLWTLKYKVYCVNITMYLWKKKSSLVCCYISKPAYRSQCAESGWRNFKKLDTLCVCVWVCVCVSEWVCVCMCVCVCVCV